LRYRVEIESFPKAAIVQIANESLSVLNAAGQPVERVESLKPRDSSFLLRPTYRYQRSLPYLIAMSEELARWFFYYLEPRERMRLANPLKEVRHIGLMGEELAAFLNTLHALDERQFGAVEKALHMVVPSITGIEVSINNVGDVELRFLEGQTTIPRHVVSEGTLRVLGLLALGGAKEPPALIGFEEPENGIHPDRLDLIALLLENLASNDTQVIVTTHSPTLIDFVPQQSLYVFNRVNRNTRITSFSTLKTRRHKSDNREDLAVSERLMRGDLYA
jgi:predicted ATPase